ncbi:hypothetical protein ACFQDL_25810 [Marinobacterium aestuariivivens]|uniref:Uncharacterized protein n=2 Tax=Marinobacterium aestuariivivens TaxID=1698799 RepID=A0ABW2A6Q8_9GAMM
MVKRDGGLAPTSTGTKKKNIPTALNRISLAIDSGLKETKLAVPFLFMEMPIFFILGSPTAIAPLADPSPPQAPCPCSRFTVFDSRRFIGICQQSGDGWAGGPPARPANRSLNHCSQAALPTVSAMLPFVATRILPGPRGARFPFVCICIYIRLWNVNCFMQIGSAAAEQNGFY